MPAVRRSQEIHVKRIDGVLSPLLTHLGIDEAVRFEGMKKEWVRLFGEPLSLHMRPSSLKGGELLIHVDSPLWLHQLSFFKAEILKKLHYFKVREIRFRLGGIGHLAKIHPSVSLEPEEPPLDMDSLRYIEETTDEIQDPELRDCARKAMRKYFKGMKDWGDTDKKS
jgi:Dna[CI] antecedent, DciA